MRYDTRLAALLRAEPKLPKVKEQIIAALTEHGHATRLELSSMTGRPINSLSAAVKSLLDAKIIEEFDHVMHAGTGCRAWSLRLKKETECPA